MPRVPTLDPSKIDVAKAPNVTQSILTSPDMFGAAQGRMKVRMGSAVERVGDVFQQNAERLKRENDRATALEAAVAARREVAGLAAQAPDATAQAEPTATLAKKVRDINKHYLKDKSQDQREAFEKRFVPAASSILEESAVKEATQRQERINAAEQQIIEDAFSDIAANAGDDAKVDQAFAQVVEMEEERAERLGLTPGQRNAAANALRARMVDTRANAIMILDPDQARDFIRSAAGLLPAPMRAEWLRRIDNARVTRKQGRAAAQSAARVQVNQAFDDAKWQALEHRKPGAPDPGRQCRRVARAARPRLERPGHPHRAYRRHAHRQPTLRNRHHPLADQAGGIRPEANLAQGRRQDAPVPAGHADPDPRRPHPPYPHRQPQRQARSPVGGLPQPRRHRPRLGRGSRPGHGRPGPNPRPTAPAPRPE